MGIVLWNLVICQSQRQSLREQRAQNIQPVRTLTSRKKKCYADRLGMHSACIFGVTLQFLGAVPLPGSGVLRLYRGVNGAHPARTAVGWVSCRCTIRSGWPSNGPRSQLLNTGKSFPFRPPVAVTISVNTCRSMSSLEDNQGIFDEGLEGRAQAMGCGGNRITHQGKHYSFEDVFIMPKPVQKPIPTYVRIVLQAFDRAGGAAQSRPSHRRRHGFGRLKQVVKFLNLLFVCSNTVPKPGRLDSRGAHSLTSPNISGKRTPSARARSAIIANA